MSRTTTVSILIGNPAPPKHRNPAIGLDVNADGFISPIDALLVINFLNLNGPATAVGNIPDPPPYRDTNGDNFITSNDALLVINYLNLNGNGRPGGEGEGASTAQDELALGWQSMVARPMSNVAIAMERTVQRQADTGAEASQAGLGQDAELSLAEYLQQVGSELDESAYDFVGDASLDGSVATDLAIADLLGVGPEEKKRSKA